MVATWRAAARRAAPFKRGPVTRNKWVFHPLYVLLVSAVVLWMECVTLLSNCTAKKKEEKKITEQNLLSIATTANMTFLCNNYHAKLFRSAAGNHRTRTIRRRRAHTHFVGVIRVAATTGGWGCTRISMTWRTLASGFLSPSPSPLGPSILEPDLNANK